MGPRQVGKTTTCRSFEPIETLFITHGMIRWNWEQILLGPKTIAMAAGLKAFLNQNLLLFLMKFIRLERFF